MIGQGDGSRGTKRRTSIGVALFVSILSSIGLTITYGLGGQPQVEGALIAVSLGGLAYAFAAWGKHLMPGGHFVQEREPLSVQGDDRQRFLEDLSRGGATVERRTFLSKLLLGALGALGLAAVFPIRSLGPKPGSSLFRTAWRAGTRAVTPDGKPVTVSQLDVGSVLTVFPEGHTDAADSQTLLIKVEPTDFHALPGREDWSPDGLVAYSKICTHAGCPVGLYEQRSGRLFCPCHQSVFDALNGAKPTQGPATRPLPQLPLEVDADGSVVARGDFSGPVGPGFWNLS